MARKQEVREECFKKLVVESLIVESLMVKSLDKGSKAEDERGMTTPWRGRIVVGLEAQPLLLLSPYLIKLLRLELYDGELLTKSQ
jgi:hypothetical protein